MEASGSKSYKDSDDMNNNIHHSGVEYKADAKSSSSSSASDCKLQLNSLTALEEKLRRVEIEEELEVEDEFEALMRRPKAGEAIVATDPVARDIARGFKM